MSTSKKVMLMILIGIIYFVFDTMLQAGVFKSINNYFEGEVIEKYQGIWGPEDLEWDRENNLLFISSTNRWALNAGEPDKKDGIYVLATDVENANPLLLMSDIQGEFHPQGISLFKENNTYYLYVVNRFKNSSSVELFEFKGDFLQHIETYTDDKMFSPNDVTGDQIGKFYVTNDHGNKTDYLRTIEEYLRMPYSYLLYYDGKEFKKVHEGMVYANGVNLSNDGSQLYVTHTTGHEVFVLDRNINTGGLILKETINIGSGVDNIDVDENDVIWVAAHPKLFDFVAHVKDKSKITPSQLFSIHKKDGEYTVTKVYENDGTQLSGGSIITVNNDTAFVGCVFEDNILKLSVNP